MRKTKLTKEEQLVIVKLYKEGNSCNCISKQLNRDRITISNCLKLNNVDLRKNGEDQRKYNHDSNYFSILNNDNCYWGGFIAADGNVFTKRKTLTIGIKYSDFEHVVKFKNSINAEEPIYKRKSERSDYNAVITLVDENILFNLKNNFNIIDAKSLVIEPPIKLGREEHISSFIRGYFDGDGCVCITKNPIVSFVGTYNMLNWIKENLTKYIEKIGNPKIIKVTENNVYRLKYEGRNQVINILKWIYKYEGIKLDRKYKKLLELCNKI